MACELHTASYNFTRLFIFPCAGNVGLPPLPCMLVCDFRSAFCTRDRGCSAHPAFPAPSSLRDNDMQTSGASRRENADVYPLFDIRIEFPPRHCERSEAIHRAPGLKLDCFVAALLAMTVGRPK